MAAAGLAAAAGIAPGKIVEQFLLQVPARGGVLILAEAADLQVGVKFRQLRADDLDVEGVSYNFV